MTARRNRLWTSPRVGLEAWESAWTGHAQPRHSHDDYQISLTRSGLGSFASGGARSPCEVGQLVVIGPGEVHEVIPSGASEWRFDTLYLSEAAVRSIDVEGSLPRWGRILPRFPGASSAFLRLHRAVVEGASGLEQEEHILGLLDGLGGERFAERGPAASSSPGEAALTRVREFLDECPSGPLGLSELAALADLSPSHLSRAFRRAFGLPPHAYLVQARIHRARAWLKQGRPIVEVAARLGFADQAHLTRHFKRLVGVTPGSYRGKGRNVQDPSGARL